jgi:hypothetical protein
MLQKNIMVLLGQVLILWLQQGYVLSGAGTQTAALGFGGYVLVHHISSNRRI